MLRNVDIEDEENRSDTQSRSSASEVTTLWRYTNLFIIIIITILISGRSGEPLTLSNAASNHVYVRPASQCRAVSLAALFSAAPDCR